MDYKGLNDYEVLYMIREEDEIAYSVMYEKYYPLIKKIAKVYYGKYNDDGIDFDELCQEGFIALNNAIRCFKESNDCLFYTYLIVCIKRQMERLVKDKTRKKHKLLTKSVSLEQEISTTKLKLKEVIGSVDSDLYQIMKNDIINKELLDFKYELKGNQSLVYELKFNNFTNKEIAQLLDITPKAVDSNLRKIREKLKKYIFQND